VNGNFSSVVVCDFEYEAAPGDLPNVLCMVAYVLDENLQHVRTVRLWRGEFGSAPPFDTGPDTLFVAYSAWAEMTCFKVLGWGFPEHSFDQHTEPPATSFYHTIRTRRASGRASACRTPVAPTKLTAGSTSTRKQSPRTLVKGVGRSMVNLPYSNIARKTSARPHSCSTGN
jgi:hypothetical protein